MRKPLLILASLFLAGCELQPVEPVLVAAEQTSSVRTDAKAKLLSPQQKSSNEVTYQVFMPEPGSYHVYAYYVRFDGSYFSYLKDPNPTILSGGKVEKVNFACSQLVTAKDKFFIMVYDMNGHVVLSGQVNP